MTMMVTCCTLDSLRVPPIECCARRPNHKPTPGPSKAHQEAGPNSLFASRAGTPLASMIRRLAIRTAKAPINPTPYAKAPHKMPPRCRATKYDKPAATAPNMNQGSMRKSESLIRDNCQSKTPERPLYPFRTDAPQISADHIPSIFCVTELQTYGPPAKSEEQAVKTVYLELRFERPDFRGLYGNAWIVPGDHSRDSDGWPLLTPHCATLGEFEWHIDRFHRELEEIRKEARKRFAAAEANPPTPGDLAVQ
jgi:hypothetical protein